MQIATGLSIKKDPVQAAKEAIALANLNLKSEKVDLIIVFSSIDLAFASLLETIGFSFEENVPVVGCSGAAVISNQGIFMHAVAVALLSFSEGEYLNTASVQNIKSKTALVAGTELAEKLLYSFKDVRRVLSVIFSDGLIDEGSNLIHGLQERLGTSFPLVGASASDNLNFLKTYVYYNKEIFSDAAAGILLGGKFNFGLGIKHGWKPIGKERKVTRSQGNIVWEIDNQPAIKIYEEYLACKTAELQKELKRISVFYPIGIYLPGEQEYLLRNISSIEKDGSLRFQGNISQGSQIRLMIGTKESCLAPTRQACEEAKKNLSGSAKELKKTNNFVLVFDSISRYMLLKRGADKELQIIKEAVGENTPIIGLYTYGEQAPLLAVSYEGQSYFHNQTIAILNIGG